MAGLLLAAALGAGALVPGRAEAHAGYARSEPAFAAELGEAPERIDLWFSQELFRREGANTIRVLDATGVARPLGEATVDADDRAHLFALLEAELAPGRYLVEWSNLSAADGEDDAGRYSFYVAHTPTATEKAEDRALAAELLIPFPDSHDEGDQMGDGLTETDEAPDPDDSGPTTVPLAEDDPGGGVGAGPIALGAVSVLALLGLAGGRLRRAGRKGRS